MSHSYEDRTQALRNDPRNWLITGVSGFIGSNLLEQLLGLDQFVVGLDNHSTGSSTNLEEVRALVTTEQWDRFSFLEGDIRSLETCREACRAIDFVLHHAALGSVPRSILDPIATTENNVGGTLNMLVAARDAKVKRFVFASSSSVYGDHPGLPKNEDIIGTPLSPYAVSKYVNELHAAQFSRHYGLRTMGLRYFNVFGPRQDPHGAYAAVIPRWFAALANGDSVTIFGDGQTSRDFCYVDNVVQANILAATVERSAAHDLVYNIALNDRTTLNDLFEIIRSLLQPFNAALADSKPEHREFRGGDVMHSQANIDKARALLGYEPLVRVREGLARIVPWYRGIKAER